MTASSLSRFATALATKAFNLAHSRSLCNEEHEARQQRVREVRRCNASHLYSSISRSRLLLLLGALGVVTDCNQYASDDTFDCFLHSDRSANSRRHVNGMSPAQLAGNVRSEVCQTG